MTFQVEEAPTTYFVGNVNLMDLDNNGTSEVVVQTYSGGASCCTTTTVYGRQGDRFRTTKLEEMDGNGDEFKDLGGDRRLEFVTYDNAFLYAFSSHAGSFAPTCFWMTCLGDSPHPKELISLNESILAKFRSTITL